MRRKTKVSYDSDVVLGEVYRDDQTGLEGHATAIYFYQHGCERVNIETFDETRKQVVSTTFDAPRLTHISSGRKVRVERTGGPGNGLEARPDPLR